MVEASTPPDANARNWATVCHLSAFAIFFGAPFGNILGPLIVYLIKKDEDPFIAFAGREALNFQILISICWFVLMIAYIATFISAIALTVHGSVAKPYPPIVLLVVMLFFVILIIFDFVSVVIASVRTNKGELYRYPITVRFVR